VGISPSDGKEPSLLWFGSHLQWASHTTLTYIYQLHPRIFPYESGSQPRAAKIMCPRPFWPPLQTPVITSEFCWYVRGCQCVAGGANRRPP